MKRPRTNTEDRRAHVALYGDVQGVGFRWFVHRAATRLELAGYVRNRADGAVELEVAGPAGAIAELLRTVENGPPMAHVERVESLDASADTLSAPFEIRH